MILAGSFHRNHARAVSGFNAVKHCIFKQRLKQQVRRFRIIRRIVLPHHLHPCGAHADLLDGHIFLRPFDFLPQSAVLAAIFELRPKKIG